MQLIEIQIIAKTILQIATFENAAVSLQMVITHFIVDLLGILFNSNLDCSKNYIRIYN